MRRKGLNERVDFFLIYGNAKRNRGIEITLGHIHASAVATQPNLPSRQKYEIESVQFAFLFFPFPLSLSLTQRTRTPCAPKFFVLLLSCVALVPVFFRSFFFVFISVKISTLVHQEHYFSMSFFSYHRLFLKSVGMTTTTTAAAMMTRNIDYGTTCTCISLCDIVLFIISCTFVPYVLISNRMFHFQFCAQNLMCMLMICEALNITVKKQHV